MTSYVPVPTKLRCRNCGTSAQKKLSEIRNYMTYLCLVCQKKLAINSNKCSFISSAFNKTQRSHVNLVTNYNLTVLNKLILLKGKSESHALRSPPVNSNCNFAIFIYPVSQRLQAPQLLLLE